LAVRFVQISELQRDALVELLNIGFGRAGAALSRLTNQRVILDVPRVGVHAMNQLTAHLAVLTSEDVATVHQPFAGTLAGDALLILSPESAVKLQELLTDEPSLPLTLDASSREVLSEVGNILLNACIGTFGNLLQVPVTFDAPDINVASLQFVLEQLNDGEQDQFRYALLITAGFKLRDAEIIGYMVIVLSVPSLTRLLEAVEIWERSQV
jgi:chemotaxis protein CheC